MNRENTYKHVHEQLADRLTGLPCCEHHEDRRAVSICSSCFSPLCAECTMVNDSSVFCADCRPVASRMPGPMRDSLELLGFLVKRPWFLTLAATIAAFLFIALCLPELYTPRKTELPEWAKNLKFRAPFLEQSFRLQRIGAMFEARNQPRRAAGYYTRAEKATVRYLAEPMTAAHSNQILLGIGQLQQKLGRTNEAMDVYIRVANTRDVRDETKALAFYLGGGVYEKGRDDPAAALDYYKKALRYIEVETGLIEGFIKASVKSRNKDEQSFFITQALTSHVNGPALRDLPQLAENGVQRCQNLLEIRKSNAALDGKSRKP